MAQNVDNAKWAGNVTVSPFSFTEEDNRLLISQSAHNFRVENRTTRNVGMRADYAREAATTHHALINTFRKNADNENCHLVTARRAQELR